MVANARTAAPTAWLPDMQSLLDFTLLFAQEAQSAPKSAPEGPSIFSMLGPFLIIGVLFYIMMIRPEKKKRAAAAAMMDNLKKNDRIVTIGGLIGVVVNVQKDSDEVTIRIDENNNTRLRILRSAVSRVLTEDGDGEKKD